MFKNKLAVNGKYYQFIKILFLSNGYISQVSEENRKYVIDMSKDMKNT